MEVIWSDISLQHMKEIAQYVADNFGQKTAVDSLLRIQKKANALVKFPEQGVLERKYSTDEYTVHHINVDPNVIYYMVYPDAVVIGIIVHKSRSPRTVNSILKRFLEHYER